MTDAPQMPHRSGYVAIVGRPNVGKSTLLNRLIGHKLSITSRRAQTTRHRILGVLTRPDAQLLFIDSPGHQVRAGAALDRLLNRTARQVAVDADVVVMVCDAHGWTDADRALVRQLPPDRPTILAINKVDAIRDRARLLGLVHAATADRGTFRSLRHRNARRFFAGLLVSGFWLTDFSPGLLFSFFSLQAPPVTIATRMHRVCA